jgi:heptosyltransferase-1
MIHSKKDNGKVLKVGRLKLADGWRGLVCLRDSSGRNFSLTDWAECLARPRSALEDYEKLLKAEEPSLVVQKNLKIGRQRLSVVVKYDARRAGLREWLRSLRFSKAARNFRTARRLLERDIQAAVPVAAVYKRKCFSIIESIYITEYIEGSVNLYHFLRGQLPQDRMEQYALKKQLTEQIAGILARLHKVGLWHRDAKAGNFIVCRDSDGRCSVKLVDMDGIKRYMLNRRRRQFQPLWRLAASLVGLVNRSDFLRTFNLYCNLCGLQENRRQVYRRLISQASAKWLLSLNKTGMVKDSINNILIIKPSSLGDIVLALPALSSLRKGFPAARISWLVRPDFAPLLQDHPYLDEIILFDRKFLGKAWCNPAALLELIALIKQLRSKRFDLVFDFQGLLRTGILSWLSGCKKRVGMANARELGHLFYNQKVVQDRNCIHLVDYYRKMVTASGIKAGEIEFLLPCREQAGQHVMRLLMEQGVDEKNYAVFVPGSVRAEKCWPVERYALLADMLASDFGVGVVTVGTEAEKQITKRLKMLAKTAVANFTCLTDIPELIALLRGARIVISNDTGPGHIASALGVPTVLIFGPTNPARVAPYRKNESVVAVDGDKRGSKLHSSEQRYKIEAVGIKEVYAKVSKQLALGIR